MDKEAFVDYYVAENPMGIVSREQFETEMVAIPCYCGESGCVGWAAFPTTEIALIRQHERTKGKASGKKNSK